jgi:uncharacterized integral membrane protein
MTAAQGAPQDGRVTMTQAPEPQDNRTVSGGAIASLSGLAVLAVFVVQNQQEVNFRFLWISFTWPLWLYTIVVAAVGALVWLGLGMMRRRRRRKERRDERRD